MKRHIWAIEIYRGISDFEDWEVYEVSKTNTREACRQIIKIETSWKTLPNYKFRIVKYVPQEKAK